jgi:hypothetical protein
MNLRPMLGTAILCAAVLATPALLGASSAGCDGFNGTWKSTYEGGAGDTLTMVIDGTTGTYSGGSLTGKISGKVFTGTYKEKEETGKFKFTLQADGNSFVGQYTVNGSGETGNWRGTCTGS